MAADLLQVRKTDQRLRKTRLVLKTQGAARTETDLQRRGCSHSLAEMGRSVGFPSVN